MQRDGHERETCRQDRTCWRTDGSRSRCFVLELGVKPTQGVLLCHHGKQLFGERQKIQNSSAYYMGEEICRSNNERGQRLHLKGKNIFWCPDILLKRGIFSDQLGGTPMWEIPHFCSCLVVCKSFISVGTTKWFCNSPNQKKNKKRKEKGVIDFKSL